MNYDQVKKIYMTHHLRTTITMLARVQRNANVCPQSSIKWLLLHKQTGIFMLLSAYRRKRHTVIDLCHRWCASVRLWRQSRERHKWFIKDFLLARAGSTSLEFRIFAHISPVTIFGIFILRFSLIAVLSSRCHERNFLFLDTKRYVHI